MLSICLIYEPPGLPLPSWPSLLQSCPSLQVRSLSYPSSSTSTKLEPVTVIPPSILNA
jgi:hypothetical protein